MSAEFFVYLFQVKFELLLRKANLQYRAPNSSHIQIFSESCQIFNVVVLFPIDFALN